MCIYKYACIYIYIAPKELLKLVNFRRHIAGIIIYGRNQNHRFPDCVSVSHLVVWLYYHLLVSILGYNGMKLIYSLYVLIHRGISSYIFMYHHILSYFTMFVMVYLSQRRVPPLQTPWTNGLPKQGSNKPTWPQQKNIPSCWNPKLAGHVTS